MSRADVPLALGILVAFAVLAVLVNWSLRSSGPALPAPLELQTPMIERSAGPTDVLERAELGASGQRSFKGSEVTIAAHESDAAPGAETMATRFVKLQALHERLLGCRVGSELEWRTAYDLMTEAMLVEKDHQQDFVEGNGSPFRTRSVADSFHTYNSGRQYAWSRAEYPHLAAMFVAAQIGGAGVVGHDSKHVALHLTEEQREATLAAYNAALARLTDTHGLKGK